MPKLLEEITDNAKSDLLMTAIDKGLAETKKPLLHHNETLPTISGNSHNDRYSLGRL